MTTTTCGLCGKPFPGMTYQQHRAEQCPSAPPRTGPTAPDVFRYTLDNLYEGASGGDVATPMGWFAVVHYTDGEWYVIAEDDLGFLYLSPPMGRALAQREFEEMSAAYVSWVAEYTENAQS